MPKPNPNNSKCYLISENQWNDRFSDAVKYIRQSLDREDILQASVKEVRRVLECDRVVVYSLDRNLRYGAVIAESVAPGWTKALNKQKLKIPVLNLPIGKNIATVELEPGIIFTSLA